MRSKFFNILAMTFVVISMLGATALPQAAAQETGSPAPGGRPFTGAAGVGGDDFYPVPPTGCEDVPPATIQIIDGDLVILFPEIWLACVTNVLVEACSDCVTLFDGRPPATRILRLSLAALEAGDHTISVTGTTAEGALVVSSLEITTGVGNASVPAAQIIPVSTSGGLATTGSNVDFPLAVGVALVGAGGLALLIARQRERQTVTVS